MDKPRNKNVELFCLCRQPYDGKRFMVGCDTCPGWYHLPCVGLLDAQKPYLDELKWHCPVCVSKLHDQVRSLMSRNLELEDQQWKLISDNLQYHQKRSQMLEERLKTSQREIAAFQSEVQTLHQVKNSSINSSLGVVGSLSVPCLSESPSLTKTSNIRSSLGEIPSNDVDVTCSSTSQGLSATQPMGIQKRLGLKALFLSQDLGRQNSGTKVKEANLLTLKNNENNSDLLQNGERKKISKAKSLSLKNNGNKSDLLTWQTLSQDGKKKDNKAKYFSVKNNENESDEGDLSDDAFQPKKKQKSRQN